MSKKTKLIKDLEQYDITSFEPLKSKINTLDTIKDILYNANVSVFQSSSINHKHRLKLLKQIKSLSNHHEEIFCLAHNLTLTIKLSKELGLKGNLVKDSHKAIKLWKKVLDDPLAINGLIFSYTDLGLLYSDYNINSYALKYLNKAKSILNECKEDYNPYTKLYVAFGVVYSRMKKNTKSEYYYTKVITRAKGKNDTMTLIPILINTSHYFLDNKEFVKAKKRCEEALSFSEDNNDQIYRPHIYHCLGKINFEFKKYKDAEFYLEKAYSSFKKISAEKILPETMLDLGLLLTKQKKYNSAEKYFFNALEYNKKIKNNTLNISICKGLCELFKENGNKDDFLKITLKLNNYLETHLNNKEKIYSDNTDLAIKHLSEEFDLSIKQRKDLKIKLNKERKKRQLATEALESVSEGEFLNKVINKLTAQQIDNNKLISICKQRLSQTKDWDVFMKLFNDINPEFNRYLINKCPQITESELRVCNLIKMSFKTDEIAEILSVSNRGVEQHRYRIKKKLKISGDLSIFLQSL